MAGEEKQKIVTMASMFDIITNIERRKKKKEYLKLLNSAKARLPWKPTLVT